MKTLKKLARGNSGSAAFFGSVSLGILVTSLLGVLFMTEGVHQKNIIKKASVLESYYTNEVAQWNGYERTSRGSDVGTSPDANGFFSCTLTTSYAAFLPALTTRFSTETYDENMSEQFAYSLKTTSQFDLIGALNRRLTPGNLHYQVINK